MKIVMKAVALLTALALLPVGTTAALAETQAATFTLQFGQTYKDFEGVLPEDASAAAANEGNDPATGTDVTSAPAQSPELTETPASTETPESTPAPTTAESTPKPDSDTLTITAVGYEGTYDGEAHGGTITVMPTEGTTLSYSTDGGNTWSTEAPTVTDVTAENVVVKQDGKPAGKEEEMQEATTVITQIVPVKVIVRAKNPYYETVETSYTLTVRHQLVTVMAGDLELTYGQVPGKDGIGLMTATVEPASLANTIKYELDSGANVEPGWVRAGTHLIIPSPAKDSTLDEAGNSVQGNYAIKFVPGTLTVHPKPITIVPSENQGKEYGDKEPELTAEEIEGFLQKDLEGERDVPLISYTLKREEGENPGTYKISAVYDEQVQGNYALSCKEGVLFTIAKKPVTIKTDEQHKTYGEADPALKAKVVDTKGNEITTDEIGYTLEREPGENKGTYAVNVKDITASENYDMVTPGEGTFTIDPKGVTVTAEAKEAVYGEAIPELTAKVEGVLEGDKTTIAYSLTRAEGTDAGTYAVTFDKPAKEQGNYAVTFVDAELTIAPRPVTITVDAASKNIGEADPVFTGKVDGLLQEGDLGEVKYVRQDASELAGVYMGALTAQYTANKNYDVKIIPGDFTIIGEVIGIDAVISTDATSGEPVQYGFGESVPVTITVTNKTNQIMLNVTVSAGDAVFAQSDAYAASGNTAVIVSIPAEGSVVLTANHAVTGEDVLAGRYQDTVTATTINGEKAETQVETDAIAKPVPSLSVTMSPDMTGVLPGVGVGIPCQIAVANTGNVALTNVKVSHTPTVIFDANAGYTVEADGTVTIPELAAGQTMIVNATYVITQKDLDEGFIHTATSAVADEAIDSQAPSGFSRPESSTENTIALYKNVTVTVRWADGDGYYRTAQPVTLRLMNGETVVGEISADARSMGSEWSYTFENMPISDENGTITYTVQEVMEPMNGRYDVVHNGLEVTNVGTVNVMFVDWNGVVVQSTWVAIGDSVAQPEGPQRAGYAFARWTDGTWTNVMRDQIIRASYQTLFDVIEEGNIPLAGGTVQNVGDCFD